MNMYEAVLFLSGLLFFTGHVTSSPENFLAPRKGSRVSHTSTVDYLFQRRKLQRKEPQPDVIYVDLGTLQLPLNLADIEDSLRANPGESVSNIGKLIASLLDEDSRSELGVDLDKVVGQIASAMDMFEARAKKVMDDITLTDLDVKLITDGFQQLESMMKQNNITQIDISKMRKIMLGDRDPYLQNL